MALFLGTTSNKNVYIGSTKIQKVYLGASQLYAAYFDLGSESAYHETFGTGSKGGVSASSGFTFNSNGSVTAVNGITSPYTNWNISGGAYLSWKETYSEGFGSFTTPIAQSTDSGENRIQINANRAFLVSVSAGGNSDDYQALSKVIEVSIWDSLSGGTLISRGTYSMFASAEWFYQSDINSPEQLPV